MKNFEELPLDVKRLIGKYIKRPTDLKNLCLVSKDMREIATPLLYRVVHLRLATQEDHCLTSMLNPQNPGLQHVRQLFMRLEKQVKPKDKAESSDDSDPEEFIEEAVMAKFAQFSIKMLLDYLPANTLEEFIWCTWKPLSNANFKLLLRKQKKLKELEIHPHEDDVFPTLEKDPKLFEGFTDLHTLTVSPDCLGSMKCAQNFIEKYPQIRHLHVATAFQYHRTRVEGLDDSSTEPGLISRTLFSHMLPFDNISEPLNLKTLYLDEVNLRYSADTWMKIINMTNLEELEIRTCKGVDALYSQLSKPHNRPQRLKTLRWFGTDSSGNSDALEAFEGLLSSITSLQTLNIWLSTNDLPKIDSIARQTNLTSLAVHCGDNSSYPSVYDDESLNTLSTSCPHLRELAILFPELSTSTDTRFPAPFQIFLDIVGKMQELVTLNIRNWPTPREYSYFPPGKRDARRSLALYEHDLQRFSQMIFDSRDADARENGTGLGDRSRLALVAWGPPGPSERSSSDEFDLVQIPFLRGTLTDPFSKSSMHAVKMNWRMAALVEPESNILSFAQHDLFQPVEGLAPKRN